jgi:hypothetical protein
VAGVLFFLPERKILSSSIDYLSGDKRRQKKFPDVYFNAEGIFFINRLIFKYVQRNNAPPPFKTLAYAVKGKVNNIADNRAAGISRNCVAVTRNKNFCAERNESRIRCDYAVLTKFAGGSVVAHTRLHAAVTRRLDFNNSAVVERFASIFEDVQVAGIFVERGISSAPANSVRFNAATTLEIFQRVNGHFVANAVNFAVVETELTQFILEMNNAVALHAEFDNVTNARILNDFADSFYRA